MTTRRSASATIGTTALIMASSLLAGCGDDEAALVVQLFKPESSSGSVELHASQDGVTRSVTVDNQAFDSCEGNRVRVILRSERQLILQADGASGLTATKVVADTRAALDAPVQLVLGSGSLIPAACAPAPPARDTGDPCERDGECRGNRCIGVFTTQGGETRLPGNYCSRDCTQDATVCEAGNACVNMTDGFGLKTEAVCLDHCTRADDCRDGYTCTTNDVCLPSTGK